MLKFYANPVSPFAAKVHFMLEEVSIPFTYHGLNLRDDKARQELTAVNPFGKVPAIDLNGFKIGESNAILRYLAARFERFDLYPVNLEDRAQVDAVHEFAQNHLARHLLALAWNLHWAPKFGMPSDLKAADDARALVLPMLDRFDRAIAGRAYLAGAQLTLADIGLAPFVAWQNYTQVSLRDYPNLQAWSDRVLARPSWKRVAADIEKRLGLLLAGK